MENKPNPWLYVAYAVAWIATSFAVGVGIYITQNPICLFAMLIPAGISLNVRTS